MKTIASAPLAEKCHDAAVRPPAIKKRGLYILVSVLFTAPIRRYSPTGC
ncbi:hypothetical protein [Citrobacter freundii]|uniref:Uncharacterized protein n=1 Tax=Citrobacter freundii TaxID=546 RepID=A0A7G2IL77_CITFR|nr:hypothetical protein [Citrobacter freundii]